MKFRGGVEIKAAADTVADHVKVYLKLSDVWLGRFSYRSVVANGRTFGETISACAEGVKVSVIKRDSVRPPRCK